MTHEEGSAEDERRWLADAGEPERIAYVRADRWITYPRAAAILDQMQRLLDHPRNSRMPSLLIIGESGIGKTQLGLKFCRDHPARFDEQSRRTVSPVVSIQMPAAPTDRLFYMTLLGAVGAVFSPRISTAEAMITALRLFADLGVRVVIFDEIHNMLSGTFRDQRRILTQLRYLSNELRVSVICLGIETARDAIAGDHSLPAASAWSNYPHGKPTRTSGRWSRRCSATFRFGAPPCSTPPPCKRSFARHVATPRDCSNSLGTWPSPPFAAVKSELPLRQSGLGGRRCTTGPWRDEPIHAASKAARTAARDSAG